MFIIIFLRLLVIFFRVLSFKSYFLDHNPHNFLIIFLLFFFPLDFLLDHKSSFIKELV